jgi:hypothetical protein
VCDNTTLNVGSQCPTLNVVFFLRCTFRTVGIISWVKQKLKKFVMLWIKEGARSFTNLNDTLFNLIASDFVEKTASATSCADLLRNEKGVKSWNRTENKTPPAREFFLEWERIFFRILCLFLFTAFVIYWWKKIRWKLLCRDFDYLVQRTLVVIIFHLNFLIKLSK